MEYEILQIEKIYDSTFKRIVETNIKPVIDFIESMGIDFKKIILKTDFETIFFNNANERENLQYKIQSLLSSEGGDLQVRREITKEIIINELFDASITSKTIIEEIIISLAYKIRNSLNEGNKDLFARVKKPYKIPVTYFDNENRIDLYKEFGIDYKRALHDMKCKRYRSGKIDEVTTNKITYDKNLLLDIYEKYIEEEIIKSINDRLNKNDLTTPFLLKKALDRILDDIHDTFDKLTIFTHKINNNKLIESYIMSRISLEENPKDYKRAESYKKYLDEIKNIPDEIFEEYTRSETDVERKIFTKLLYNTETDLRNGRIKKIYKKMKKENIENEK